MKHTLFLFCFLFSPLAYSQEAVKVKVTKPGTLSALLTDVQQDTCQYLAVSGKLNSADIKVLRKMAGANGRGKLHTLNIKDATIVSSDEPYLIIQNAEETIIPWISVEWGSRWLNYSDFDPIVTIRNALYVLPWNAKKLNADATAMNVSRWKKVKRQTTSAKGHRVERNKDGHYTYIAHSRKKLFCKDMFYLCPNLRLIILPSKGNLYDGVITSDDPIRYIVARRKHCSLK